MSDGPKDARHDDSDGSDAMRLLLAKTALVRGRQVWRVPKPMLVRVHAGCRIHRRRAPDILPSALRPARRADGTTMCTRKVHTAGGSNCLVFWRAPLRGEDGVEFLQTEQAIDPAGKQNMRVEDATDCGKGMPRVEAHWKDAALS
jgi:hypothetical protein